jgi:hypothetical protein
VRTSAGSPCRAAPWTLAAAGIIGPRGIIERGDVAASEACSAILPRLGSHSRTLAEHWQQSEDMAGNDLKGSRVKHPCTLYF